MSAKFLSFAVFLFLTFTTASAGPTELLEQNARIHEVMGKLLELAQERHEKNKIGEDVTDTTHLQEQLNSILFLESDPAVILSVASAAMSQGGNAGDGVVGDVYIFIVDLCVARIEEIGTDEARKGLEIFQTTMRLDGGLSLTVQEVLERMEMK